MTIQQKRQLKQLQQALDDFPRIVAQKKKRAIERKRFVEKTFGDLSRQLDREQKRAKSMRTK